MRLKLNGRLITFWPFNIQIFLDLHANLSFLIFGYAL